MLVDCHINTWFRGHYQPVENVNLKSESESEIEAARLSSIYCEIIHTIFEYKSNINLHKLHNTKPPVKIYFFFSLSLFCGWYILKTNLILHVNAFMVFLFYNNIVYA